MPFESVAQQHFLEAHPEKVGGKEKLKEWESSTDYSHLPKHIHEYAHAPYSAVKKLGD